VTAGAREGRGASVHQRVGFIPSSGLHFDRFLNAEQEHPMYCSAITPLAERLDYPVELEDVVIIQVMEFRDIPIAALCRAAPQRNAFQSKNRARHTIGQPRGKTRRRDRRFLENELADDAADGPRDRNAVVR
jgi:hypothetical protein